MTTELTQRHCEPCTAKTPPLKPPEIFKLHEKTSDWAITTGHKLVRTFTCPDFVAAISFVNRVAELAEAEDHHPSITIDYRKVTFTIWTHAIDDLSENDFILAAKIDGTYAQGGFAGAGRE
jgi:4a-hydroxytetrahydrobiopterin dehydratase